MACRYRQTAGLLKKVSNYPYSIWNFLVDSTWFDFHCILYQIRMILLLYFHIFELSH